MVGHTLGQKIVEMIAVTAADHWRRSRVLHTDVLIRLIVGAGWAAASDVLNTIAQIRIKIISRWALDARSGNGVDNQEVLVNVRIAVLILHSESESVVPCISDEAVEGETWGIGGVVERELHGFRQGVFEKLASQLSRVGSASGLNQNFLPKGLIHDRCRQIAIRAEFRVVRVDCVLRVEAEFARRLFEGRLCHESDTPLAGELRSSQEVGARSGGILKVNAGRKSRAQDAPVDGVTLSGSFEINFSLKVGAFLNTESVLIDLDVSRV